MNNMQVLFSRVVWKTELDNESKLSVLMPAHPKHTMSY